jgi:RNA-directed DNA polymerase
MFIKIFRRISDEDISFMGFSPVWSRPEWMICQVLAVPPPSVRPSVKYDSSQRSEDDLTYILLQIIKANKTAKQMSLIGMLNPVLRGWANYHCHIVAKKTFSWIDAQVWSALWQWAKRRHPNKSARWIKEKYYKTRGYREWMFTAIDESNKHKKLSLVLEADTPIKRHVQIKGMANPHDPVWTQYFEARRNKQRTKSILRCCRVPRGTFAEA